MENSRVISEAQSVDFLVSLIGSPYALISGLKKEDESFAFPKAKLFLDNFVTFLNMGYLINQPLGAKDINELANIGDCVYMLNSLIMKIVAVGTDFNDVNDYLMLTDGGAECPVHSLVSDAFVVRTNTVKEIFFLFTEQMLLTETTVPQYKEMLTNKVNGTGGDEDADN